jgi:hypothetical protein
MNWKDDKEYILLIIWFFIVPFIFIALTLPTLKYLAND